VGARPANADFLLLQGHRKVLAIGVVFDKGTVNRRIQGGMRSGKPNMIVKD
jgi:hypothetical protein